MSDDVAVFDGSHLISLYSLHAMGSLALFGAGCFWSTLSLSIYLKLETNLWAIAILSSHQVG